MNAPVVVGIDGSDSALEAVRWAAAAACERRAPLHVVYAYEIPVGYPPGLVNPATLREALVEQGRDWLARAGAEAGHATQGLEVETVEVAASAVPTLVRLSADAALVVVGTRGLGGFTGLLLGSTAVEVAARAHCPVVVVRGTDRDGPVVVGVDGTPAGEAAIAFAFEAAATRGVDLVAVHTWTDLVLEGLAGAAALDFGPLEQHAEAVLGERLAGWREKFPDVRVTRHVSREPVSRALLRSAEDAGLVVVGSRGRGGFRGLLLGSTSQTLLHHAPCPVAVVRSARP